MQLFEQFRSVEEWDIMSQIPGAGQDISSQEKQDTRHITTLFSTGMLVSEYTMGVRPPLAFEGERNHDFYTTVSREWH